MNQTQSQSHVSMVKSKEEYEQRLNQFPDRLVVVDFYAEWCGPCKMIAPKIEEMAAEMIDKVTFLKIDVDELGDLAEEAGVSAMPTFKLYKNGKELKEVVGANADKIREAIVANM